MKKIEIVNNALAASGCHFGDTTPEKFAKKHTKNYLIHWAKWLVESNEVRGE